MTLQVMHLLTDNYLQLLMAAKYEQIIDYINSKIEDQTLKAGMRVPSENALVNKFGVSRDTIRRAFGELESSGVLLSVRGSGTFVRRSRSSSNRIAVVTTYVENYIFPKIITGIDEVLLSAGYMMQLSFTNNRFERERRVLEDIIEKNDVAGVIMEPVKSALPNPNLDCYERLKNAGIPILFINSYYRETDIPHVALDDEQMGYIATRYLIEKGHTKIGAVLKMDDGQGHLRFSGYRRAMNEIGDVSPSDYVVWFDTSDEQDIPSLGAHIQKRLSDCTAVFCYNDTIAVDFVKFLEKCGRKVPEDISVISMDDSMFAELGDVKLTSCPHPLDELGRCAAQNIIKLIKNPKFDATKEFVTGVHERESVKNISK